MIPAVILAGVLVLLLRWRRNKARLSRLPSLTHDFTEHRAVYSRVPSRSARRKHYR